MASDLPVTESKDSFPEKVVLNGVLEDKPSEGDSCFLDRGDHMSHVRQSWGVCMFREGHLPHKNGLEGWRVGEKKDGRLMKLINQQDLIDDHFNPILIYFCTFISQWLFYKSNTYSLYKSDSWRLKSDKANVTTSQNLKFTILSPWANMGLNFS